MLEVEEGRAEAMSRKDIFCSADQSLFSLVQAKVERGAPGVSGRLLEVTPTAMLLLLFFKQNLLTWTHLFARRLGNVFFICGSCVPCYSSGVLLL